MSVALRPIISLSPLSVAWTLCAAMILLLVLTGCRPSVSNSNSSENQENAAPPTIAESNQPPSSDANNQPPQTPLDDANSSDDELMESKVLRNEILEMFVEQARQRQPGFDPSQAEGEIEKMIGSMREQSPQFLMVSTEKERRLSEGVPIEDAERRIAESIAVMLEYNIPLGGLVVQLNQLHEAGELPPARTELLAQMLKATVDLTLHNLSN